MTHEEFNNEFDLVYNNINSNQAPGLDFYEKSVFLTSAQEDIIKKYFTPKGNKYQEGFDDSERRQVDFSNLINVISDLEVNNNEVIIPSDVHIFLLLNEYAIVDNQQKVVVPLNYKEYERLMSRPYPFPLKSQVWRLDKGLGRFKLITEPSKEIEGYTIRFLRKPKPIILQNLDELDSTLSIDGEVNKSTPCCELDASLHRDIINRAAELAKAAYIGDLGAMLQIGNSSQTNIGYPYSPNRQ